MGSQVPHTHHQSHHAGHGDIEKLSAKPQDLIKYENQLPAFTYARLATQRPKLLPEVEDTIQKQAKGSKISGSSQGIKLPTYQLLKTPGLYYEGEWKNKLENGKGSVRGLNGTYLEAYFINGKANGHGLHVYPDGSYYNGQLKDGVFEGKGKFYYKLNEMTYEGDWKYGKPDGEGVQTFKGIGKYTGKFVQGIKQGKGEMKWVDGRVYEGEFKDGYMHGIGVLTKGKGRYEGNFDKNNKTGNSMKTEFGTFSGGFVRGEMSGPGKFVWYNGNVYEGDFKFNKMDGNGKMILKNGQQYSGIWDNGVNVKIYQ